MMKWSMIQLRKQPENLLEIDEKVDLEEFLKANNPDVRKATPVHVTGNLQVSQDSVTATLRLQGEWTLPCARTLVDVQVPYDIHSIESFTKSTAQLLDESWHLMEQDIVELTPVVEELLLVEIPMQVFSSDADSETLPKGKEWELQTEEQNLAAKEQAAPKVDPRLAGLAQFFDEEKE
ncbi:Uncharacterized ACR, COG1399 [Listeria grayi]|nr:Uncharacterized ACR, COG1399 [Listeria grayi]